MSRTGLQLGVSNPSPPGFNNDLAMRNQLLADKGVQAPRVIKTGTTIAGCICKGAVVLGADTRATEGPIVADKECNKIHRITENIYAAGAGTAADCDHVTERSPRVVTAVTMLKQHLFQYQGHVSTAIILGGVDITGPSLYTIHPHGSSSKVPYLSMGSGSLAAMAMLETYWRDDMEIEEAKQLIHRSILAGIFNDLGSGGSVDIAVVTPNNPTQHFRHYDEPNPKKPMLRDYSIKKGSTDAKAPVLTAPVTDAMQVE